MSAIIKAAPAPEEITLRASWDETGAVTIEEPGGRVYVDPDALLIGQAARALGVTANAIRGRVYKGIYRQVRWAMTRNGPAQLLSRAEVMAPATDHPHPSTEKIEGESTPGRALARRAPQQILEHSSTDVAPLLDRLVEQVSGSGERITAALHEVARAQREVARETRSLRDDLRRLVEREKLEGRRQPGLLERALKRLL